MPGDLRIGSKGTAVKELQTLLNQKLKPDAQIAEDGLFGPSTDRLVRRFQAINGIGVDGVVGPETRDALTGRTSADTYTAAAMSTASTPWMTHANNEIRQTEIRGPEHNPRIIAYHSTTSLKAGDDETPWCSSFVNWCLKQAGIAGTRSAAAISWMSWGKPTSTRFGAIAVINNSRAVNSSLTTSGNHVGFLVQEAATHFLLLGGNQSDQVRISRYPKSSWTLRGYRWPTP